MLLDHTTAFMDYCSVDLLLELPRRPAEPLAISRLRPLEGGVLPGTLIETAEGFRQARTLRPGDRVQTFDGGLREVVKVRQSVPRLSAMVHVPAGVLGNDAALEMPSDAVVAVEGDLALDLFDLPVVTVKLVALIGYKGIASALPQRLARVHIECAEEELLWGEGGLIVNAGPALEEAFYAPLSFVEARRIVEASREDAVENVLVERTESEEAADRHFFGLTTLPVPTLPAFDMFFRRSAA